MEKQVRDLLKKSLSIGKTFIITNAGEGWVENSSAKFMPKLYKEIIDDNKELTIISARKLYEKKFPSTFISLISTL